MDLLRDFITHTPIDLSQMPALTLRRVVPRDHSDRSRIGCLQARALRVIKGGGTHRLIVVRFIGTMVSSLISV